jgi:hypothetical protein
MYMVLRKETICCHTSRLNLNHLGLGAKSRRNMKVGIFFGLNRLQLIEKSRFEKTN